MTDQDFQLLVTRYFDDALDESELEVLSKELLMNEKRVVLFNDMRLQVAQILECERDASVGLGDAASNSEPRRFPYWLLAVAAAVVLVAGIVMSRSGAPPAREVVAVFEAGNHAVFEQELAPGETMPSGLMVLKSGMAQVRFSLGARVEVEGPAVFRVTSPLEMSLQSGKLLAEVPKASHGFTVNAGELRIVDLGTVFSAQVDAETKEAEADVLVGSVEVSYKQTVPKMLLAGEGVRLRDGLLLPHKTAAHRMAAGVAFAGRKGQITVQNHSFEVSGLTDGPYHGLIYRDLPDQWVHGVYRSGVWQDAPVDYAGVVNCPIVEGHDEPGAGYPPVPDGERAGWVKAGEFRQVLNAPLQKLRTYRLTVAVASHGSTGPGSNHPNYGDWGNDYEIAIRAGGAVLARTTGQLPAGTPYRDVEVEFSCPLEHPAVGLPLEVSLGATHRVFFDDVRVTVE